MKKLELNESVFFSFIACDGRRSKIEEKMQQIGLAYKTKIIDKRTSRYTIEKDFNSVFIVELYDLFCTHN